MSIIVKELEANRSYENIYFYRGSVGSDDVLVSQTSLQSWGLPQADIDGTAYCCLKVSGLAR